MVKKNALIEAVMLTSRHFNRYKEYKAVKLVLTLERSTCILNRKLIYYSIPVCSFQEAGLKKEEIHYF